MYLRITKRRNKDGSIVKYYALAENVRHPEKGYVEAKVVHSFGRSDRLDRAALERLIQSVRRVLDDSGEAVSLDAPARIGDVEIEDSFDLGVVHVAKALWQKLGIGEAIQKRVQEKKLKAPHYAQLAELPGAVDGISAHAMRATPPPMPSSTRPTSPRSRNGSATPISAPPGSTIGAHPGPRTARHFASDTNLGPSILSIYQN